MNNNTYMQPTVRADVRNNSKWTRVRMALAGSGSAGVMLAGGLLASPAAHAQTLQPKTATVAHVTTAQMSYSVANDYVSMARQAASNAGISPDAFQRQIQQESGFNPNATSPAGAVGIAQFMPGTAAAMGVNPYDPSSALNGGARLMAGLSAQFGGDYAKALAAYNAGPGAVQAAVAQGGSNWLSYVPAETQNYVHVIWG